MRVIKKVRLAGTQRITKKRTTGNNTGIYGPQFGSRPNNAVRGRGGR